MFAKDLKLLERGFPVSISKNKVHIVHVDYVVSAMMKSAKKGSGIYNIADKEPIDFNEC